jgi:hypothetical protein
MATKKLKAELEVETSKAKQKIAREFAETGGGGAGGGGVSHAADDAARNLRNLSNGAKDASDRLQGVGKMFVGIGVGLARAAMGGGDSSFAGNAAIQAVSAFSMGTAAGGKKAGAAAALASIGISYFESKHKELDEMVANSKLRVSNMEDLKAWEEARKRTLAFRETLEELTKVSGDAADRQERLAEEIRKREEADHGLYAAAFREIGDPAAFRRAMARRQENAAELDQLRALEKQQPSSSGAADWHGVDALSSVGGMFAGSGAGARAIEDLADTADEQLKVLKSIERNTQEGGATWQ